jgi:hypothetical protein
VTTPETQIHAMRLLGENWDGYGAAATHAHVLDLAHEFVALIEALLRKRAIDPGVVHVSPTRTGGVLVEWEAGIMQHEVEINPDHSFAFLHLNKTTGHIETRKLSPGPQAVVHPALLQELCQLLAA